MHVLGRLARVDPLEHGDPADLGGRRGTRADDVSDCDQARSGAMVAAPPPRSRLTSRPEPAPIWFWYRYRRSSDARSKKLEPDVVGDAPDQLGVLPEQPVRVPLVAQDPCSRFGGERRPDCRPRTATRGRTRTPARPRRRERRCSPVRAPAPRPAPRSLAQPERRQHEDLVDQKRARGSPRRARTR